MPFAKKKEQRQMPPVVYTDDVIPVHLFDGSAAARSIVLAWTFKFDEVLDPRKLKASLTELFEMDGWRKFSGRFRYLPDGNMEIHVPRPCTEERPAVLYSEERHEGPMSEHPLASKLPQPTGQVKLYSGPKHFCDLGLPPGMPRTLDDYVYLGAPQFCMHAHTFTDSTLVCITFSHMTMDLMGMIALLEAWCSVLAGKPEDVKPLKGYHEDPFKGLWESPAKEKHMFADKILAGWRFKYWGIRSLYEAWRGPEVRTHTLCVPDHVMQKLVQEARSQIDNKESDRNKFISEGDILTAAACKVLARSQGPGSTRELATILALDPRSHAKSVFRPDEAYVQNPPSNVFFFCRADVALETPLGQLALMVRRQIAGQAKEEQLKAAARLSVEAMKSTNMAVIFGDKDMATQFVSNWSKGPIAETMDFSPAIVKEAAPGPWRGKRGHPVYFQTSDPGHNTVSVISSVYSMLGKDYSGNRWFSIALPKTLWGDWMEFFGEVYVESRL